MKKVWMGVWGVALTAALAYLAPVATAGGCVVAQDGSGDFTTIQAALEAMADDNAERYIVEIRDGVYTEKIRIDSNRVTLRGQSRGGTRIEFSQDRTAYDAHPDSLGAGVININGDDVIIENLTAENTVTEIGPHAFTIFGRGTRTIIQNANCYSLGADTVSLWAKEGRYYHANCDFKGAVDFVCPRGWCYVTDCKFFEHKRGSAAIWHDGDNFSGKKFVLENCFFDGVKGFTLGRRHRDAQFYLLDCTFSERMADRPIYRKTYPDNPGKDGPNQWGDRYYYYHCHRMGGDDFSWYANNLETASGSPSPCQITAAWTFDDQWDPERIDPPTIKSYLRTAQRVIITMSEDVTVEGVPKIDLAGGGQVSYAVGSGTSKLVFLGNDGGVPAMLDPDGGALIACEATAATRSITKKIAIPQK